MALPRTRRRRSCLGALGYVVVGALICAAVVVAVTWRHVDRVRQWHPYGAAGPVVTAWHTYTWAGALGSGLLGYDRYELTAGPDPSGSYGADVPVRRGFGPPYDDLAKTRVTGDARGITIIYPGGDRVFLPKDSLKGR